MGKTFHFLAGLHRSGNTLLASILTQNPNIYTSPIGPLCEYMWKCHTTREDSVLDKTGPYDHRSINMISNMIQNYYYDVPQKIVIDTGKSWLNTANLQMIKQYISNEPKILFTTRPLLEIITSYIAIDKNNLLLHMNNSDFIQDRKKSQNDNLAEFLMSEHSSLGLFIKFSFQSIDDLKNKNFIHIIKYEDLINSPKNTMSNIYNFLEIDNFDHDFNQIKNPYKYHEEKAYLPHNLHEVRPVLKKSGLKVENYLSSEIIEKYKDARYF